MQEMLSRTPTNLARPLGEWRPSSGGDSPDLDLGAALRRIDQPFAIVSTPNGLAATLGGITTLGTEASDGLPVLAVVPAIRPEQLGDPEFAGTHGVRYPYAGGAMANGIASVELVSALAREGFLAFFGAAGLPVERVTEAVDRLQAELGGTPFGVNLIHSPNERDMEERLVDLFLDRGIRLVEASAFLRITPAIVRYRLSGAHRDSEGRAIAPNRVIAKVSREELAEKFFSPAPEKVVRRLLEEGKLGPDEAALAAEIPLAEDVTAEADSGGHTDHRPALALLPTLLSLRGRMAETHGYSVPLRVGLGGGISTPASAAAAFAMGAAYVVTGSVNQACAESGTSDAVREMLAETRQADVGRAPAADMFEMGVTVQVLKRGTMFAMRGSKLYELYRAYESIEAIPDAEREKLEKTVFRKSLDDVWTDTHAFFSERDPRQIERAEGDPKHKMALVFRWYLGQSSHWANRGVSDRQMDYQVWCGPAMGAFNEWAAGSCLDAPSERRVALVAKNILYGAAVTQRIQTLRAQGVPLTTEETRIAPQAGEVLSVHFRS